MILHMHAVRSQSTESDTSLSTLRTSSIHYHRNSVHQPVGQHTCSPVIKVERYLQEITARISVTASNKIGYVELAARPNLLC